MYLGTYTFDGDPDELLSRYDRMIASFPDEALLVHLCVRGENGITIIDTCPNEADFRAFSTGPDFQAALGSHLRNSVRTGIFCSYRPEQPLEWRL